MLDVIAQSGVLAVPDISANTNIPGIPQLQGLVGSLITVALIMTVVGLILSAGLWAVGAFSNNYNQSINGKRGFLVCAAAAIVIGAAVALVEYFYGEVGGTVSSQGGGAN